MFHLVPRQLPPLSAMLEDLGNPSTKTLSQFFDISSQTVKRWIASDSAPRTALISLFWLTRWGQSSINVQHENNARIHAGLARALGEENETLRLKLARLHRIADFGAANDASSLFPSRPKNLLFMTRIESVSAEEKHHAGSIQPPSSAFAGLR